MGSPSSYRARARTLPGTGTLIERVLQYLADHPNTTAAEITHGLDADMASVAGTLHRLYTACRVNREHGGPRKGYRYRLA